MAGEKEETKTKPIDYAKNEQTWNSLFSVKRWDAKRDPIGPYFRLVKGELKAGMVAVVVPCTMYFKDGVLRTRRKAKSKNQAWHVISFGPRKPGGRNWLIGRRIM